MGIAGGESVSCPSSGLGGDAIGHADRATASMVMTGPQSACPEPDFGVDDDSVDQLELGQVEGGIFFVGSDQADQVIEHFGHADGRQGGITATQQRSDLAGGGFCPHVGNDGVRVEDGQRLRDASARRAWWRALSAEGPRPRYLPSSSTMGCAGAGRITTRSPRSTTIT